MSEAHQRNGRQFALPPAERDRIPRCTTAVGLVVSEYHQMSPIYGAMKEGGDQIQTSVTEGHAKRRRCPCLVIQLTKELSENPEYPQEVQLGVPRAPNGQCPVQSLEGITASYSGL